MPSNTGQEIRRIFHSRIETVADALGVITATPSKWGQNSRGANNQGGRRDNGRRGQNQEFRELGGEYLHFTLYKENKDTMDAVNTIARLLKVKASNFGFAGTKDRRAGTVQRISVHRQKPSNLTWLNTRIPNVKVGEFEFSKNPLQLGQHGGNEFIITLKNCEPIGGNDCSLVPRMKMIQQSLECGLAYLKHNGYINYYGLQRFGTYSIGTHLLGMKILREDYEGFIDDILHVDHDLIREVLNNPPQPYVAGKDFQNRDDQNRARAITTWKTTRNAEKALEFLPKRFSSETAIIRHLAKAPKDFNGAILSITRGMRMMYIHAYQSYVWNYVATRRWSKHGPKVIEGDLVLVTDTPRHESPDGEYNPYDDDDDDNMYAQARALTAADVASGKYTIFDVVLPTPGYDVLYPRNEIGEYYAEFMGKEENGALSPYEMRRKQREFSLSGNYRPLIGRFIADAQYAIRAYCDDMEQMYPTDLDYATHKKTLERQAKAKALLMGPASLGSWRHFANNPSTHDDAMASERRRKAEDEAPSDRVVMTKETWVQTGVDGSAKRVKLARHQFENQTINDLPHGYAALTNPTLSTMPAVKSESSLSDDDDDSFLHIPGSGGAPLFSPKKQASPPRVITDGPIPMITIPKDTIPTSGIRGVSDTYYASTGQKPYFGAILTNMQTPVNGVATQQGPAIKSESLDMFGWYGANLPKVSETTTVSRENGTKDPQPTNSSSDGPELINGIALPKWRTASSNPLSTAPNDIDEATIDPAATKVAVILKFQLKQSNYATIVLRELMGTTAEERAL